MTLSLPKRLLISICVLFFIPSLLFFYLCLSPSPVFAEMKINEISPWSEPDWVEIVNTATNSVSLEHYLIRDSTVSNKKILSGEIPANGYLKVDFSNYLNKDGDTVRLLISADSTESEIDRLDYGKQLVCPEQAAQSVGRLPDLTGTFQMLAAGTPDGSNNTAPVLSCNSPTPTLKPSVTPKPTGTPKPQDAATNTISKVQLSTPVKTSADIPPGDSGNETASFSLDTEVTNNVIRSEASGAATVSAFVSEGNFPATGAMVLGTAAPDQKRNFILPALLAAVGVVTGIGSLAATGIAARKVKPVK
jgi:hypothetical protein